MRSTPGLHLKYWARLKSLAEGKHSSLIGHSVGDKEKKVLWQKELVFKNFFPVLH
jgi:hypothetical protein